MGFAFNDIRRRLTKKKKNYFYFYFYFFIFYFYSYFLKKGGYDNVNVARAWTSLISFLTKIPISQNIPSTFKKIQLFRPTFKINVESSLIEDKNTPIYLEELKKVIAENIEKILN